MATFDNDYILTQVKLKASLPDGRYEDEEILAVAYDQLLSVVMPFIISMREEFYVMSAQYTVAAGIASIAIPDRAHNLVLREVKRIDGNRVIDLDRVDVESVETSATGTPDAFYLKGNDVVLYPTPASDVMVELSYFQIPSDLALVADCARITAIDNGTLSASIPTTFTAGDEYDIVSKSNGHIAKLVDITPSGVTTNDITFTDDLTDVVVGDYVCLAKTSPFAQVPDGVQPWLVMLTVAELLESMGSLNEASVARGKSDMLMGKLESTLSVRVQGAPKRLTTNLI